MPASGSPNEHGSSTTNKRSLAQSPATSSGAADDHPTSGASAFRNVSACNRCRVRKNRCDQKLPACTACEKAGTKCVSYDHITKREVPRSYVYYLETRLAYLENLLHENNIEFTTADEFVYAQPPQTEKPAKIIRSTASHQAIAPATGVTRGSATSKTQEQDKLDRLVSSASKVAVQGTSDSRYLGAASGISFARVVFAAVKSSLPANSQRRASNGSEAISGRRTSTLSPTSVTMQESFFGLHTKPNISPAPFPSRDLGLRLVNLYFEHANPQVPTLHRPEFMAVFDDVYAGSGRPLTPKESFLLNIVFAIGAAIIVGKPAELEDHASASPMDRNSFDRPSKRRRIAEEQRPPEEYHASAIVHLESVLNAQGGSGSVGADLEGLQAVLLLASFALLRPIPPGLWYIIGVAVRLAVDLGLHADDDLGGDQISSGFPTSIKGDIGGRKKQNIAQDTKDQGRKHYISDFRRRLWWCTYSLDRLVSSVVGRPFGISDRFVTTQFPTLFDDKFITPYGIITPPEGFRSPSYKRVSYHYFRYRLLQSEILQVLQYQQTQLVRERGINQENPYMLTDLPCPFLKSFNGSFRRWRMDIDKRLLDWRDSAPTSAETGVEFSPLFLELNYWHAVLMLFRQSLSVPPDLAEEAELTEGVSSPLVLNIEDNEDADTVFMKVAAAGQKVLKIYRLLHRKYLVNYTYLSTHHLFMAGISFLYAIWHSPVVRRSLTLDDVDFTALAGTSVLEDLVVFCPPARACHDAFSRMTKATIKMCLATTGFGKQTRLESSSGLIDPQLQTMPTYPTMGTPSPQQDSPEAIMDPNNPNFPYAPTPATESRNRRSMFDTDLRGLFSEEESAGKTFSSQLVSMHPYANTPIENINYSSHTNSADASMAAMALQSPTQRTFPGPRTSYSGYSQQFGTPTAQGQNGWTEELAFLDAVNLPASFGMDMNDPGTDSLGFGFGWDGSIPGVGIDDNKSSFDLFDGFFFGNNNIGTGYDGANDGMEMSNQ